MHNDNTDTLKDCSCLQVGADDHTFSEPNLPVVSQVKYAQSAEALHQVRHLLQLTASNVEPLQAGEACYASREGPLRLLGCSQQVVLQIKRLQCAQSAQHLQNQHFSLQHWLRTTKLEILSGRLNERLKMMKPAAELLSGCHR